jgi:hypothetical protein
MAYRPLADGPEEHIALRARRASRDEDRHSDEDPGNEETLHEPEPEIDT